MATRKPGRGANWEETLCWVVSFCTCAINSLARLWCKIWKIDQKGYSEQWQIFSWFAFQTFIPSSAWFKWYSYIISSNDWPLHLNIPNVVEAKKLPNNKKGEHHLHIFPFTFSKMMYVTFWMALLTWPSLWPLNHWSHHSLRWNNIAPNVSFMGGWWDIMVLFNLESGLSKKDNGSENII